MEHLVPEKKPSRLWIKRGHEANMFSTISSTEGTWRNVKKKVERLVILWVIERANDHEWGAPSFAQTKPKTDRVRFLSDFRNINK